MIKDLRYEIIKLMLSQKGFTPLIILIIILVIGGLAGGAFYLGFKNNKSPHPIVTSNNFPSPTPLLPSSTPSESTSSSTLDTSKTPIPNNQGECPVGYVNYGMPLGCISKDSYWATHKGRGPICLASSSRISTPTGNIKVTDLKLGMIVWSVDSRGNKIAVPIIKLANMDVPKDFQIVHIILSDKREAFISSPHPTINGLTIGQLKVGEEYDRSTISKLEYYPYWDNKTYDLLPDSETGYYWANGILIGSTLK